MKLPDKIYIVGAAGSGKSTLAKKISSIKNIPSFDWDDIIWFKKYTEKLDKKGRKKKIQQIIKENKKRVIEGGGGIDRTYECYENAELVIILNVGKLTTARRIFKRYIYQITHGDFKQTFFGMIKIIQRSMTYKNPKSKHSLYRHIEDCKKYRCRYIVIRDAKDILD